MLKLSRAMVGHAEAMCQMLFGMLLDLCPKVLSPRSTEILSGFWQVMLDPFGGQTQGSKQHFGARLAIVGPVKVSGSYSSASCGKAGGSWGQVGLSGGHVEAKLGYVMSCWSYMSDFVGPCCWFCIQTWSPPSRTKILSGFLPAMLAPLWGQIRLSCGYVGIVGTILRSTSATYRGPWWWYVGSILRTQVRHRQKPPQTIPPKRSPSWPPRRNEIDSKNHPWKQNFFQNDLAQESLIQRSCTKALEAPDTEIPTQTSCARDPQWSRTSSRPRGSWYREPDTEILAQEILIHWSCAEALGAPDTEAPTQTSCARVLHWSCTSAPRGSCWGDLDADILIQWSCTSGPRGS